MLEPQKVYNLNNNTYLSFSPGNSLPSRNPKPANISPAIPLDSFKNKPQGKTNDFTGTGIGTGTGTGTGSYANDKPSSNTPSWGTQEGIANRKGLFILSEL